MWRSAHLGYFHFHCRNEKCPFVPYDSNAPLLVDKNLSTNTQRGIMNALQVNSTSSIKGKVMKVYSK